MRNSMLLVLMVVLSGCTERSAINPQDQHTPPAADHRLQSSQASGQAGIGQSPAAQDVGMPAKAARLALEGAGLRIFSVANGSSRALAFGNGKTQALTALEAVQGMPPSDLGENIDCGATSAVWPDGLTVWFTHDKFVGWSVASAASALSTAGGLKVGSTRAEVEHGASVASIARSSLGEEFTAGNVAGLLDSAAAEARVTNLWAGAACIAR